MGVWSELLGAKLQSKNGEVDADSLAKNGNKAVALYFSAHWCPPCRGFTPKLAEWYKKDLKTAGLEVVFVSSDRDDKSFSDYYGEMPWLALPFAQKDVKAALSKKFKVQGIPSLVILNAQTAETITTKGRDAVSNDPEGKDLPWEPKSLHQLLGGAEYVDSEGKSLKYEAFSGKKLGLYFSAHWCPPCRGFTPVLAGVYNKLMEQKEQFEIVFVSSDRTENDFKEYFAEMPWKALKFDDRKLKADLSSHFEVNGIPCFIMLDENREVLNKDAAGMVRAADDAEAAAKSYPFVPPLVPDVDEMCDGIDEAPSVIVLMEEVDANKQAETQKWLEALAEKKKAEKAGFNFFAAKKGGRISQQVRDKCGVKAAKTDIAAVMMDIEDSGAYYEIPADKLSEAGLAGWLADFRAGKCARKQMG